MQQPIVIFVEIFHQGLATHLLNFKFDWRPPPRAPARLLFLRTNDDELMTITACHLLSACYGRPMHASTPL